MSSAPHFHIVDKAGLIKASLEGRWNTQIDLAYITRLSEFMQKNNHKPWALLVDMRGWRVPPDVKLFKHENVFHLDRRNQKAECWLVEDKDQGVHLIHYLTIAKIPFRRCLDVDSAQTFLQQFGFAL